MAFSFDDLANIPTFGGYAAAKKLTTGEWTGGGVPGMGDGGAPGNQEHQAHNFGDSPYYDPNAFQLGGQGERLVDDPAGGYDEVPLPWGGTVKVPKKKLIASYSNQEKERLLGRSGEIDARAGVQMDQQAYGLAREAAMGRAPSQAERLGRAQTEDSIRAGQSMAASVRGGPGAQAAAMRAVNQAQGSQRAAANQQIMAMRANEDAVARGQYLGAATTQAELEARQRQMNDTRAMGYEGMRQDVDKTQLEAKLKQQEMLQRSKDTQDQINYKVSSDNAKNSKDLFDKGVDIVAGSAQGGISGGTTGSDVRMKEGFEPVGSLAGMPGGGMKGMDFGDGDSGAVMSGGGMDVMGTMRKYSDMGGAMKPVGGPMTMVSDKAAKTTAFRLGESIGHRAAASGKKPVSDAQASAMAKQADDMKTKDAANLARGAAAGAPAAGAPEAAPPPAATAAPQKEAVTSGGSPEWLKRYKEQNGDEFAPRYGYFDNQDTSPYGTFGARRGYANARAGQPGGMFSSPDEPAAQTQTTAAQAPRAYSSGDTTAADRARGVAPGTSDFDRQTTGSDARMKRETTYSSKETKDDVRSTSKAKGRVTASFAAKLRDEKPIGNDYGSVPIANPGDIDPSLRDSGLRLAVANDGARYKLDPIANASPSLSRSSEVKRRPSGGGGGGDGPDGDTGNGGRPDGKDDENGSNSGGPTEPPNPPPPPPKKRAPTLGEAERWADTETAKTRAATTNIPREGYAVRDDQAPPQWLTNAMQDERDTVKSDDKTKLAAAFRQGMAYKEDFESSGGKKGTLPGYMPNEPARGGGATGLDITQKQTAGIKSVNKPLAEGGAPELPGDKEYDPGEIARGHEAVQRYKAEKQRATGPNKIRNDFEQREARAELKGGVRRSAERAVASADAVPTEGMTPSMAQDRARSEAAYSASLSSPTERAAGSFEALRRPPSLGDRTVDSMTDTAVNAMGAANPVQDVSAQPGTAAGRIRARARAIAEQRDTTSSDKRAKKVLEKEEPMADAMRTMEPSAYAYKPEFTPPGQKPGETNVGPIAQNMEKDPVAGTAIVKEDDGLLAIDKEKGLKLVMGGLASLQDQVDALAGAYSRKKKTA